MIRLPFFPPATPLQQADLLRRSAPQLLKPAYSHSGGWRREAVQRALDDAHQLAISAWRQFVQSRVAIVTLPDAELFKLRQAFPTAMQSVAACGELRRGPLRDGGQWRCAQLPEQLNHPDFGELLVRYLEQLPAELCRQLSPCVHLVGEPQLRIEAVGGCQAQQPIEAVRVQAECQVAAFTPDARLELDARYAPSPEAA